MFEHLVQHMHGYLTQVVFFSSAENTAKKFGVHYQVRTVE